MWFIFFILLFLPKLHPCLLCPLHLPHACVFVPWVREYYNYPSRKLQPPCFQDKIQFVFMVSNSMNGTKEMGRGTDWQLMPEKLSGCCLFSHWGIIGLKLAVSELVPQLDVMQTFILILFWNSVHVSHVKKCDVNHFRTNNAQRWICNFPYKCAAIDCNDFFPKNCCAW